LILAGACDTHTDRHRQRAMADLDGFAHHGDDSVGQLPRVGARHSGHDNRELVAAEPPDDVAPATLVRQPLRDNPEHSVADVVAERVVDKLEAIDIAEEDRERLAVCCVAPAGHLDAVHEECAIGEAGQRIVRRKKCELGRQPARCTEIDLFEREFGTRLTELPDRSDPLVPHAPDSVGAFEI
jgi:hypothetical protein